ncbi:hypothetical protein Cob_v000908 [Colletotrichum orbiculare MAFF 240422]|uniref:Uncharacterized protein n=1 Tax=Colletotrichum orbiculare (strain 104-T / ATCC 96160 / CBS 514.97 / LARS 414 / MAFF 240422) TaxID=1213857 RepID=A0A484G955_COLOR|nr:hypothetical protein Cob_v000908 [Colletotrichum orbiculare MAFF 240422]
MPYISSAVRNQRFTALTRATGILVPAQHGQRTARGLNWMGDVGCTRDSLVLTTTKIGANIGPEVIVPLGASLVPPSSQGQLRRVSIGGTILGWHPNGDGRMWCTPFRHPDPVCPCRVFETLIFVG